MGFQLICTFVPGTANRAPLGQLTELSEENGSGLNYEAMSQPESIRAAVLALAERELSRASYDHPSGSSFADWIRGLEQDKDLLIDENVVVHQSPPDWLPLTKIIVQTPVAGIFAYQMTHGGSVVDAVMWVFAYGGCRIFLRLATGSEAMIGSLFDDVRRKSLPDYKPDRKRTHFITANSTINLSGSASAQTVATPPPPPPNRRRSMISPN